jgi:MerR family transcriptional regulator/heat shock protein HspR
MAQQRQAEMQGRVEPDTIPRGKIPSDTPNTPPTPPRNGVAEGQVNASDIDDEIAMQMEGVYIISVAARILDMHPQTLRKYERLGLIRPGRTLGMLRLYSTEDIRKLRLIRHLSDGMGLNLAGVEFVLAAVQNLLTMQQRLAARLGPEAGEAVAEELDLLFHSLNLPVDH